MGTVGLGVAGTTEEREGVRERQQEAMGLMRTRGPVANTSPGERMTQEF